MPFFGVDEPAQGSPLRHRTHFGDDGIPFSGHWQAHESARRDFAARPRYGAGEDRGCALEMVQASGVQTNSDRLIDRQLERAGISVIAGFSRIFDGAVRVLVYSGAKPYRSLCAGAARELERGECDGCGPEVRPQENEHAARVKPERPLSAPKSSEIWKRWQRGLKSERDSFKLLTLPILLSYNMSVTGGIDSCV